MQNDMQNPQAEQVDMRVRVLLFTVRQAAIMIIGGIEDFLGIERSIVPRNKRKGESDEPKHTPGKISRS